MSVNPSIKRALLTMSAALAMSTVAVAAAVGPAHAAGNSAKVSVNA